MLHFKESGIRIGCFQKMRHSDWCLPETDPWFWVPSDGLRDQLSAHAIFSEFGWCLSTARLIQPDFEDKNEIQADGRIHASSVRDTVRTVHIGRNGQLFQIRYWEYRIISTWVFDQLNTLIILSEPFLFRKGNVQDDKHLYDSAIGSASNNWWHTRGDGYKWQYHKCWFIKHQIRK